MKLNRKKWQTYGLGYWQWRHQPIVGALDGPTEGAILSGPVEVYGWASTRQSTIRQVEVSLDGQPVGPVIYGLVRPDVAQARPWQNHLACGFQATLETTPGTHNLFVRITDAQGHRRDWSHFFTLIPAAPSSSPEYTYLNWITDHEPDTATLDAQRQATHNLSLQPLFSLITPVYNPPLAVLKAMVASVQAQTYGKWELCLADGASTEPGVAEFLSQASRQDERIRLVRLAQNAGIVGNSNQALRLASGEFCVLLDHDDTLAPDGLYEVATRLNQQPDLDLIYSDHDLLSEDGQTRHSPLFKPDYSPEIMLSANYLTHLTVIRRSLIEEAGGFAEKTDGAQDWDLFWRVLEHTRPDRIAHLPKVLYHWRESVSSTATDIYRKPTAPRNQVNAIEGHLHRSGLPAARAFFDGELIRVWWPLPNPPLASIIIPTKDKPELIAACVRSVLSKTSYRPFELLLIDTGSTDPAVTTFYNQLVGYPQVKVLNYRLPFNYSAVNNWAARQAKGEILVFLNNDTEVIGADWLEELVRWATLPDIGAVGTQLLKPDGTLQHAGVVVGMGGFAGHPLAGLTPPVWTTYGGSGWYRDYLAVSAACLAVRRPLFEEIGGFDEAFQLNGSDVDLGLRLRAKGYRNVYNPFARLYHIESATHGGHNVPPNDYRLSLERYQTYLAEGDPYYNPNLSYFHTIPTFHRPDDPAPLKIAQDFIEKLEQ